MTTRAILLHRFRIPLLLLMVILSGIVHKLHAQSQETLPADVKTLSEDSPEFTRYKKKLYRAVGSRWRVYVQHNESLLSSDRVKIRFYVRSNGVFEKLELLSGDRSSQLYAISRRAIMVNSGQLEPFSDEMKKQLGDGYWEEISFRLTEEDIDEPPIRKLVNEAARSRFQIDEPKQ
ncbi:MAG: hypothetical protein AAF571_09325 [Verrucomicrobiota bacterium]